MSRRVATVVGSLVVALAALATPLAGEAQPAVKVYRLGVLANTLDTSDRPPFQIFLDALRALGYVPDRTLIIEWRSAEGDFDKLPALAADLVRSKVDAIMTTGLLPTRAAAEATKTIPIVFVVTVDPVEQGLVTNAAHPGGNLTGLAAYGRQESSDKVLELLRAAVPKASRVAVLTNPVNPVTKDLMSGALPSAAQRMQMTLSPLVVRSPTDFQGAFDTAVRERADALYVPADTLAFIHRTLIADLAAKNRLPAIHASRSAVEVGGLMSYSPNMRESFRQAAAYIDKILKGAKAGDLPVGRSAKFDLVINLKTAKALGLTISPALLQRADEVIQ